VIKFPERRQKAEDREERVTVIKDAKALIEPWSKGVRKLHIVVITWNN
jgi:hypothetical protein